MMKKVLNVSFYRFFNFESHRELREVFRSRCVGLGLKGTLILSPEGINGFLAGDPEKISAFRLFLGQHPGLEDLWFKESRSEQVPFRRMRVKLKKEIIPMGLPEIRPSLFTGKRLSPARLKEWLDQGREVALVDTRNGYEIEHGTFKNAVNLGLRNFREIPGGMRDLQARLKADGRERPVVMFCTGGIRCEKATALAMQMGFEDVYQLEGGILHYFEECGQSHYEGRCFVFDERVALDESL